MKKKITAVLTLCLLFWPLVDLQADSGTKKRDDFTTQREKGVFAFFSLGAGPPDFESWIMSTDEYSQIPVKERDNYLVDHSIRLGTGYGLFDPKKDLLSIEALVSVHYVGARGDTPGRIYFQFPNQSAEYIPTFSYPYVKDEWVSLIINKLAIFADLPLSVQHLATISDNLYYENEEYEGVLTIQVRPSEADHEKPIRIGTMLQWIMIGEIAYMKCEVQSDKTGNMQQLWDYVAPWYAEEYRLKNLPEDLKYPHPFDLKK